MKERPPAEAAATIRAITDPGESAMAGDAMVFVP